MSEMLKLNTKRTFELVFNTEGRIPNKGEMNIQCTS